MLFSNPFAPQTKPAATGSIFHDRINRTHARDQ